MRGVRVTRLRHSSANLARDSIKGALGNKDDAVWVRRIAGANAGLGLVLVEKRGCAKPEVFSQAHQGCNRANGCATLTCISLQARRCLVTSAAETASATATRR